MLFLKILRLLLLVMPTMADTSPVLLWDLKNHKLPTLSTMITVTELQFKEILRPLLANNMIVTFVESELNTLDFISQNGANKTTNESSFIYLRELINKTYYGRVENPIDSLLSMSDHKSQYQIMNGRNIALDCLLNKTAFILLSSDDLFNYGNRHQLLKQHDNEIRQIVSQHFYCPIIYLYLTNSQDSSIERKRQKRTNLPLLDDASEEGTFPVIVEGNLTHFNVPGRLLFAWSAIEVITDLGVFENIECHSIDFSEVFPKNFTVELKISELNSIKFVIQLIGGYFVLTNFDYIDTRMSPRIPVMAPLAFSYFCKDVIMEADHVGFKLRFRDFQMQAQFGAVRSYKYSFGPAWHCMGFTTAPIGMAVFTTFVIIGIACIGLSLICNIHTMDKYDTLGQKTIVIEETN